VLGFLDAARRGQTELARQYLDTRLNARDAQALAHQLFIVLDARLPPRLQEISTEPEGSRANPLMPDRELVGILTSERGDVEVFLDRVQRGRTGPIWLFSNTTLEPIPALYDEISASRGAIALPGFLSRTRIGGVQLVDWLVVLLGIPLFFIATVLLNRLLLPLMRPVWRRLSGESRRPVYNVLPFPARLLLLVIVGRWLLSMLPLSLLVRQFWSNMTGLITIVAVVWLLMLVNGEIERTIRRRMPRANVAAAASLLRVLRRAVDVLIVFAGFIVTLRHFGIDPTPALAGLGVGGIAVALAAQKTLENVIAGASLVFDQAVRVGDFLKMGDIMGTVDHIGLRSTRIRTLDRSVVSVPNGQIANASLETLSARDKFWFHPEVRLRYDTTPEQLRAVLEGIRRLLGEQPSVDRESIRVRFHRLGPFSLDIDVFAYLAANDWEHFLQIQEQLLFGVTETVRRAGTGLALPSQTMYVTGAPGPGEIADTVPARSR
jgi:MscS family membrane protein